MAGRHHDEGRRYGLPAALALAVFVLAAAHVASASSLGGLRSNTLLAQRSATGAITDTFSYPDGTSLAGRATPSGGTWAVTGGSFVVTAGTVKGSTSGTVYGTVPFSACNTRIGVDIRSSGSSTFGLLINAAPSGQPSTAVLYNNSGAGTITLARVAASGGTRTPLATVNQVGGGNAVRYLTVSYYNGVYTVRFSNAVVLSYTVPAGSRPAYEANCNVGIMVDSDTKSSFDNFQAYAL